MHNIVIKEFQRENIYFNLSILKSFQENEFVHVYIT
jgi:hypothetical protein